MMETVHFKARTGSAATGILAKPTSAGRQHSYPAIIVVQEYWGVDAHIRDVTQRWANEGFIALAVDLYHGATAKTKEEAGALYGAVDWKLAVDEIAGGVAMLKSLPDCNGKVGIIGFCMGGALTLQAAACVRGLAAAAPFYGIGETKDWSAVDVPIQGHFANLDAWITPDAVNQLEQCLQEAGKSVEIFRYDADHAFFNDRRPEVYDEKSSALAWQRVVAFMRKHTQA